MKPIFIDRGMFRDYQQTPFWFNGQEWHKEMRKLIRWIQRNRLKRMYFSANQNAFIIR